MIAVRILAFLSGMAVVVVVLDAAVRTFVLPRGTPVMLSRVISLGSRWCFDRITNRINTYEGRDRVMALYGPLTLLSFPVVWVTLVLGGFTLMMWATVTSTWSDAIRLSGSSLFTLGFATPDRTAGLILVFAEATIGLGLIALLLAYLPSIYTSFSHREIAVAKLSIRAGTPPDIVGMFARATDTRFMTELDGTFWHEWELWFVEVEESHTSLAMLSFFRSPNPKRSWITAAGSVLDAAALRMSTIDAPYVPYPAICIRAGFLALRSVADIFDVDYDPDPAPDDPISITRDEFMEVYAALEARGVPVKSDAEQCWKDFAGWRVNYDAVLVAIAGLVMAPYARWISDRSLTRHRVSARRRRRVTGPGESP